jgi:Transposase DNA-binding/Transposase Tn5 dimerisation domain
VKKTSGSTHASLPSVEVWAAATYSTVQLPDERLHQRLVLTAALFAAKPSDSIPQACGSWGQAKAAYRFMENERVNKDALIQAVADATAKACEKEALVLAVQDSTSFTFPNHQTMKDLGRLSDASRRGLWLHSTLALNDKGVPLGLLHQQYWCRPEEQKGIAKQRKQRNIEDKESSKWLHGMRAARAALERNLTSGRRPRLMHVMDREGDVQEVLSDVLEHGDGAVVRSAHNRRVQMEGESILSHEAVRSAPLLGIYDIEVPRKDKEPKRKACVEVRSCCVKLSACKQENRNCPAVEMTLLEVWEREPPEGATGLRWLLWTTEEINDLQNAQRIVAIYCMRWRIEEYHLVLKSGCGVEELQFDTAERTAKAIAMYAPIAVRILHLRCQARETPEACCTEVLSEYEWHALYIYIKRKPLPKKVRPPNLQQAVLWIGRLGGHLNRKGDGMPGVRALWRGWRDLQLMTTLYTAGRISS